MLFYIIISGCGMNKKIFHIKIADDAKLKTVVIVNRTSCCTEWSALIAVDKMQESSRSLHKAK